MHADQMNEIINDQEESIEQLKQKLRDSECEREDALGQGVELVKALNRITLCASLENAIAIAKKALEVEK